MLSWYTVKRIQGRLQCTLGTLRRGFKGDYTWNTAKRIQRRLHLEHCKEDLREITLGTL